MEKNNFVYTLVITFIVGLFVGSFFTGGITGQFFRRPVPTTISVSPKEVITGHTSGTSDLTIQIVSGNKGAEVIYEIKEDQPLRSDDQDPKLNEFLWCKGLDDFGNSIIKTGSDKGSKCFSQRTFTYSLPIKGFFKDGSYYVRVYDFATKDYVKAYFKIVGYGVPEYGASRS